MGRGVMTARTWRRAEPLCLRHTMPRPAPPLFARLANPRPARPVAPAGRHKECIAPSLPLHLLSKNRPAPPRLGRPRHFRRTAASCLVA